MNPLTVSQKKKKKKKKKKKHKKKKPNKWNLHIRFLDSNVVATRYYSSEFLGKSSANNTCSHFEQCLGPLEKEKLLQVSSDGPNVNLTN